MLDLQRVATRVRKVRMHAAALGVYSIRKRSHVARYSSKPATRLQANHKTTSYRLGQPVPPRVRMLRWS